MAEPSSPPSPVEFQSVVPFAGKTFEGVPEGVVRAQDARLGRDFLTSPVVRTPRAMPAPKSWDDLNLLGKASRVLDVPLSLMTKMFVAGEAPKVSDIMTLKNQVGWRDVLLSRGYSEGVARRAGTGLDLVLHPLNFVEGPFALTRTGELAQTLKGVRMAKIAKGVVKPLEGVPGDAARLKAIFKGFEIEKGSPVAQRIAAAQAAGFNLERGVNYYEDAARGHRALLYLNVPFTSFGRIPIVPREVSMLAFGLPRALRAGFLKGAKYIPVPGKPGKSLADLALASFLKPPNVVKESDYFFRNMLKGKQQVVLKHFVDTYGDKVAKFDADVWEKVEHAFEKKTAFDLAKSEFTPRDLIKAGLPKNLAHSADVQDVLRGMRDSFKNAFTSERAEGLKVGQLEDDINYALHLISDEAKAALENSEMLSKTLRAWSTEHASFIRRTLRDKTIKEVNDLAREGKLELIPGVKVREFFQVNPLQLMTTRMWRASRSIVSAQFLKTMGKQFGKQLPAGPSPALIDEIAELTSKLQKARNAQAAVGRRIATAKNPKTVGRIKAEGARIAARVRGLKESMGVIRKDILAAKKTRQAAADKILRESLAPADYARVQALAEEAQLSTSAAARRLGLSFKSKSSLLDDFMFTDNAVLGEIDKHFARYNDVESMGDFLRYYDAALGFWKGITLAPWPSYHFRNWVDNLWRNFLARVSVGSHVYAFQALGRYSKNPEEWSKVGKLRNILTERGEKLSLDDFLNEAEGLQVLQPSARHQDVLTRESDRVMEAINSKRAGAPLGNILNPALMATRGVEGINRHVIRKGFEFGRARVENPMRLAHYIDRRIKGDSPLDAAESVKRYLFDYDELSPLERTWGKRVFPFYPFARFNIPFQFEMLAQRSGDIARLAHVASSEIIPETLGRNDRQLEAKLLRDWVRDGAPFFLGRDPKNPDKFKYWMLDGFISTTDLSRLFDPGSYFISQMSPLLREPLTQIANFDFMMRKPLTTFPGIWEMDVENEDLFNLSVPRRVAHVLRNIRLFNEYDRMLKLMEDDKTPLAVFRTLAARMLLGGSYIEVSEQKGLEDLKFRMARMAAEGRRAYVGALRRNRPEEAWEIMQVTIGRMMRGY